MLHQPAGAQPIFGVDGTTQIGWRSESLYFTFDAIEQSDGTVNSYVTWPDGTMGDIVNHPDWSEARYYLDALTLESFGIK